MHRRISRIFETIIPVAVRLFCLQTGWQGPKIALRTWRLKVVFQKKTSAIERAANLLHRGRECPSFLFTRVSIVAQTLMALGPGSLATVCRPKLVINHVRLSSLLQIAASLRTKFGRSFLLPSESLAVYCCKSSNLRTYGTIYMKSTRHLVLDGHLATVL